MLYKCIYKRVCACCLRRRRAGRRGAGGRCVKYNVGLSAGPSAGPPALASKPPWAQRCPRGKARASQNKTHKKHGFPPRGKLRFRDLEDPRGAKNPRGGGSSRGEKRRTRPRPAPRAGPGSPGGEGTLNKSFYGFQEAVEMLKQARPLKQTRPLKRTRPRAFPWHLGSVNFWVSKRGRGPAGLAALSGDARTRAGALARRVRLLRPAGEAPAAPADPASKPKTRRFRRFFDLSVYPSIRLSLSTCLYLSVYICDFT